MTHRTVIAAGDHIAQSAPLAWLPLPWCCLWAVTGVTHFPLCCDQLACQEEEAAAVPGTGIFSSVHHATHSRIFSHLLPVPLQSH